MKRTVKPDKTNVVFIFSSDCPKAVMRSLFKTSGFWQNLFGSMEAFHAGPRRHYPKQTDNPKSFENKLTYNSLLTFFFPFNKMVIIKRRGCVAAE